MGLLISLKLKWINLKLKSKLTIAFLSLVVIAILILSAAIGYSTKIFFNEYLYNQSTVKAVQWRDYLASYYTWNNLSWDGVQKLFNEPQHFPGRGRERGRIERDRIIMLDSSGKVLADSEDQLTIGNNPPRLDHKTEVDILVNNQKVGMVLIGITPPPGVITLEERFFHSVLNAIILAGLGTGLVAIILGLYYSRRISVPLVSLADGAQKLAGKDFKYRFHVPGNDEVSLLAHSLNTMAEALEKNEQIRNNLVADVAHELRTPITILRGNLESLQAGVIEPSMENIASLHDEVLRLSRLVEDLQELTLAEAGKLLLHYRTVNCIDLVRKVVHNFKGPASAKEIQITLTVPEQESIVEIDEDRVIQVLANLMTNAVRHTPQGQSINVTLFEKNDNFICIEIKDSGPGISSQDRLFIFDRFYCGSKSRNRSEGGTGLGLAIAKSLVQAHGGKIEVDCPASGGTVFQVYFPKEKTPLIY